MATIEAQGDQLIAAEQYLAEFPEKAQRALLRAMNRSIASGRTVMVREIARDTGLKSKDVRAALVMREAFANRPEASLAAKLKRLPLIDFRARGPEPSRGKGRGVTYRLQGGKGRVENAFIATMKSEHRGVFKRAGEARLGIVELKGPSLGHVFAKYRPLGLARVQEVFDKNFAHEAGFIQTGAADAE